MRICDRLFDAFDAIFADHNPNYQPNDPRTAYWLAVTRSRLASPTPTRDERPDRAPVRSVAPGETEPGSEAPAPPKRDVDDHQDVAAETGLDEGPRLIMRPEEGHTWEDLTYY